MFLGYSTLHKGFRCLAPKEGRIYISRDVVFDEHVFPFASLHPNAGARLRAEISILPDALLNPSHIGDTTLPDQRDHCSAGTHPAPSSSAVDAGVEKNSSSNHGERGSTRHHFMCSPPGGSTTPEGDRLTAETVAPGGSPSASE